VTIHHPAPGGGINKFINFRATPFYAQLCALFPGVEVCGLLRGQDVDLYAHRVQL
jgi:hypothetical protein